MLRVPRRGHAVCALAALLALFLIHSPTTRAAAGPESPFFRDRWVYVSTNLLVDDNVGSTEALIQRAAKSGYTGIMLADYKFQILDRMDERYFRNAERVKAAADRAGLEIIPSVFSIGYSNGILAHDPNLAEGILASKVPHVAREHMAVLQPLAGAHVKNGDFEQSTNSRFEGFSFQDDPGKSTIADAQEANPEGIPAGSSQARTRIREGMLASFRRFPSAPMPAIASRAGSKPATSPRPAPSTCWPGAPGVAAGR
jgi:hypothetical protein